MEKQFGIAVIERSLLRALERLWEGPLAPSHLPAVERGIRAFLISPTLVISRFDGLLSSPEPPSRPLINYEQAFGDHLLDYEFANPREPHPIIDLSRPESAFLTNLVTSTLESKIPTVVPAWIKTTAQAYAYIDAWYEGYTDDECTSAANLQGEMDDEGRQTVTRDTILEYLQTIHPISHLQPAIHARYLVGCHRAGLTVYGTSPISQICSEHLFSKWPDHLLTVLDEEYKRAAEELRGPGLGVNLPPLTAILLSRAPSRTKIPETLRDLREEYKDGRNHLWTMLHEMWTAPTYEGQLTVLRQLESVASALFKTAFPEPVDKLSVALTATKVIKGDFIGPLEKLNDWNRPRARVGALSFSAKLVADLRAHLLNHREIMRRHLTAAELREFGTMV